MNIKIEDIKKLMEEFNLELRDQAHHVGGKKVFKESPTAEKLTKYGKTALVAMKDFLTSKKTTPKESPVKHGWILLGSNIITKNNIHVRIIYGDNFSLFLECLEDIT